MENKNRRKENPLPSPVPSFSGKKLRKIAEGRATEKKSLLPKDLSKISPEEMQVMIHDLTVHQIELEMQNEEMMRLQVELNESRARYFDIYDMAPVGYLIISEQSIVLETNLTAAKLLGVDRSGLVDHRFSPFILQEDQSRYYELRKNLFDSRKPQECELRMQKKDGSVFWGHIMAAAVEGCGTRTARLVLSDISRRKADEQGLVQSEEKYRLLITSMDQGLALFKIITDTRGMPVDFEFLDINESFTRLFGYAKEKALGRKVKEIVPRSSQQLIDFFEKTALTGGPDSIETYKDPGGKFYSLYAYTPQQNEFAVLVTDINDRMVKENRITYLSYHDQLTGLYNRRFYEEEMLRLDTARDLPMSIAMGDVNGLKLINDSFGHMAGDELLKKTADIIKAGCRADDIIARLGGDEFVIILPKTDSDETEKVISRIRDLSQKVNVNDIGLSISFGFGTKTKKEQNILDVFKSAEDHMYHQKLKESSTLRTRIIDVIVNILYEKNNREMQHSKKVSKISSAIAYELNLDMEEQNKIKLAGLMHDVGKIGISEEVLNSPDKPTTEEWMQIRKHPEIGYRILSSSEEFAEIAVFVLAHHERWDGKGYPKGLKGEDIPLAARIIAVAEAFDAMTASETYKEVMGKKAAEAEIRKGSGKQFDPEIAAVLLDKILKTL